MRAATVFSDEERAFIEANRVARLATTDADGQPHAVPIVYALLDDVFYFVVDEKPKKTRHKLKRLRNIAANPRVALILDRYDDDWSRLAYLLIQGWAEEIKDPALYDTVLERLRERYPQYRTMSLAMENNPLVRITPSAKHLWRASAAD